MSSRIRIFLASLFTVGAATACLNPPVNKPDTTVVQQTPVRVPQNANNEVDVLFMVDNSLSMDAMQTELKSKFGDFLAVFQNLAKNGTAADLHIGVVTSDFGAGATGGGGCDAYGGGQKGLLQSVGAAGGTCKGPTGTPFISYKYDADSSGNGSGNLPAGQDLATTFTCSASVGSGGCGFEAQLESVNAALHNTNENAGFLRDNALLAVVYVTNEDDGSADKDGAMYNPNGDANKYGAFDTYRQTRFGVFCGGAPIPYGDGMQQNNIQNCAGAPNAGNPDNPDLLIDVNRYISAFTTPAVQGGIKQFPTDVLLFAIDGPTSPFSTILADPVSGEGTTTGSNGQPTTPQYSLCSPLGTNCQMRLQHSCQNMATPAFFADPAIRVQQVVQSVKFNQTSSICGSDLTQPPDFTQALTNLGTLISSQISPGCIPAALKGGVSGAQCIVEDVTENQDLTETITPIPQCTPSAPNMFPCWSIDVKKACATLSPDGVGITINRNGAEAPPNTNASVECSTTPAVTM